MKIALRFGVILPLFLLLVIFSAGCDCDCCDCKDCPDCRETPVVDDDTDVDDDLSFDDDTTDDDTSDDDTTDDDTGDDDTALPPDVTVSPANGDQDVPLTAIVIVQSTDPLDPETFALTLSDGINDVTGYEKFTADYTTYYFYPSQLLAEDTEYTIAFTIDESDYATDFSTIENAGDIPIQPNSGAEPGEYYGFQIVLDEVLQPAALNELILFVINQMNFLISPIFMETSSKETGTVDFSGGEATDFDGDGNLELIYGAAGYQYGGTITGNNLSMSGPFEFEIRDTLVLVDLFFLSGILDEDGEGNPYISEGYLAIITTDCESIKQAFPELALFIDLICDEETGLYAYVAIHGDFNPIPDLLFDAPVTSADRIEMAFDPPLYSDWPGVNPLNARFEVYQGETLAFSSDDYLDNVEFPDCCTQIGPDWYSFSEAAFNIPEELTLAPGEYTLRYYMGLYGVENDFVVAGDDDTADDDVVDDDTTDDDVVDDDTTG